VELVADYFAAIGRGIVAVVLWVGRLLLRLLTILVWAFVLAGVVVSYRASVVLGAVLSVVFAVGSGFVLYVVKRRSDERWEQEQAELEAAGVQISDDAGGIGSFVVKVIVALVIVVVFFKYFVQIRLVPQVGN
jgi:hypothetical protein